MLDFYLEVNKDFPVPETADTLICLHIWPSFDPLANILVYYDGAFFRMFYRVHSDKELIKDAGEFYKDKENTAFAQILADQAFQQYYRERHPYQSAVIGAEDAAALTMLLENLTPHPDAKRVPGFDGASFELDILCHGKRYAFDFWCYVVPELRDCADIVNILIAYMNLDREPYRVKVESRNAECDINSIQGKKLLELKDGEVRPAEEEEKTVIAYQYICENLEQNPGTPYAFQDVRHAGEDDVCYTLFHNDMPAAVQKKYAKACCDALVEAVAKQEVTDGLQRVLDACPTFTYAEELLRRLRNYADEGMFDRDGLYRFALMLSRERELLREVKLGIHILSLFPNDITKSVLRTLGLHSEFTMPVILSIKHWPQANRLLCDLAQNTTGYGRLAAVLLFEPITAEQQRWMFYEALKTPVHRGIIAMKCLSSVDMETFFTELSIDEASFHALSRLFTYAFLNNNAKDYEQSRMLVEKYLEKADRYGRAFIDLAALAMIESSMQPYWHTHGVDVPKQNGWSSDIENAVRESCLQYQGSNAYRASQMAAQMEWPTEDNAVIIHMLRSYDSDYSYPLPDFSAFIDMLDADPFDMDIGQFCLVEHPKEYAAAIAEHILHVVPDEVLETPAVIDEDALTPEHKPDIWLLYLLKARKTVKFECEQICLRCLSARFQEVRIEAIAVLRTIRAAWSDSVIPALEAACKAEPDAKIAKRIKRLLGIKTDDVKEQRYVEVSDMAVSRSPADKPVLDTEITGTFFRDMNVVTGVLDEGDMLFLKREPDNKYDANAILVTTEDGYVLGYIPKAENPPLAQLMDAGERFYAVLNVDPSLYEGKPPITIMVSRPVAVQGKIIQFPGISRTYNTDSQ